MISTNTNNSKNPKMNRENDTMPYGDDRSALQQQLKDGTIGQQQTSR